MCGCQVQDAGLIFLSAMASTIVRHCKEKQLDHGDIMATVLCWLALSTALLGVALYVTGRHGPSPGHRNPAAGTVYLASTYRACSFPLLLCRLKLASLVQYLPLAVIAGYLGAYSLISGTSVTPPLPPHTGCALAWPQRLLASTVSKPASPS
jgi:SulP family sulfate permease